MSISEKTNSNQEIDGASAVQPDPDNDISTAEELEDGFRDDGSWYIGKAREEFHRRRMGETRREEEEDPVQVGPIMFVVRIIWLTKSVFISVGKGMEERRKRARG